MVRLFKEVGMSAYNGNDIEKRRPCYHRHGRHAFQHGFLGDKSIRLPDRIYVTLFTHLDPFPETIGAGKGIGG